MPKDSDERRAMLENLEALHWGLILHGVLGIKDENLPVDLA